MNKIELYFQSRVTELKKSIPNFFEDRYFKDRVVVGILILSGIIFLLTWVTSFMRLHLNEFMVPVRYNSFIGVTELGSSASVYRIPIIFTFCFILNIVLSRVVYRKDKLIGYVLCGTNIVIGILTLVLIINFSRIVGA